MHADPRSLGQVGSRPARNTGKSPMARFIAGQPQYATLYTLGQVERIDVVSNEIPRRRVDESNVANTLEQ